MSLRERQEVQEVPREQHVALSPTMLDDLFALKVQLNASRLTVDIAGQVVTITAEGCTADGEPVVLSRDFALEELLRGAGGEDLVEAVLVQMAG